MLKRSLPHPAAPGTAAGRYNPPVIHITAGDLRVRDWTLADAPILARWMSDPRVLRYFGGRDDAHDEARMRAQIVEASDDIRCIFEWDGAPLGYIQFCPDAWPEYVPSSVQRPWGMDLYIGEPEHWGRGIGSQLVRAGAEFLLASGRADLVTIDPEVWNARAIRSYEKAGFAKLRFLPRAELHEGEMRDAWLMLYGLRAPRVARLDALPAAEIAPLVQEANAQGYDFVRRLAAEHASGANRFDGPGEALYGAYDGEALIGVGGLNVDHYAGDPHIGRVRHVYVLAAHRRTGAGRALLTALMSAAMTNFTTLRLRTNTLEGARFYEALGFAPLADRDATHAIDFAPAPA